MKGIDFGNSEYSNLKKVHSIWICLNPDKKWQGTINTYYLQEKHLLRNICEDKSANDISVEEKLKLLNEDFGIKTTDKLETEAANMCNYSKGVFQKGIEKGINALFSSLSELDIVEDVIIDKVSEKYDLNFEIVREMYNNYKNSQ